jgi:NAD(P)H dehydrogenase (quinone)
MARVLVLYYSSYGHMEQMAQAVAEGARGAGATVDVKRVAETVPEEVARKSHFKLEQDAPIATVADLEQYDAIVVGSPTRYGQETTLFSIITNLLHLGLVIVGLPYSFQGQMKLDEIVGGAPYGATTIAGGDGSRQPSQTELDGARFQGELVARTAAKLFG